MASAEHTLTQAELKRLLRYDPETGIFTRRVARSNRVKEGEQVGTPCQGYLKVGVGCHEFLLHRLAYLYMKGEWPEGQIDHKNNNRADNRWDNLRPATWSQQRQNSLIRSNNTSGYKGVSWNKRLSKWHAYISLNGKRQHLGYHETAEKAKKERDAVALRVHGEFACAG